MAMVAMEEGTVAAEAIIRLFGLTGHQSSLEAVPIAAAGVTVMDVPGDIIKVITEVDTTEVAVDIMVEVVDTIQVALEVETTALLELAKKTATGLAITL